MEPYVCILFHIFYTLLTYTIMRMCGNNFMLIDFIGCEISMFKVNRKMFTLAWLVAQATPNSRHPIEKNTFTTLIEVCIFDKNFTFIHSIITSYEPIQVFKKLQEFIVPLVLLNVPSKKLAFLKAIQIPSEI